MIRWLMRWWRAAPIDHRTANTTRNIVRTIPLPVVDSSPVNSGEGQC